MLYVKCSQLSGSGEQFIFELDVESVVGDRAPACVEERRDTAAIAELH